tara:strand:+ start:51 stop:221 length:171 start_codon:yes stop_codon:yes gene_type:complete
MKSSLKFLILSIPIMILTIPISRIIAIEIHAAKYPNSPTVKELRADPLRVLSFKWL